MKPILRLLFLFCITLFINIKLHAQHTFSIVAVDPVTGEIGSAGATCIKAEDGARDVSVIVLGVGAINTQAFWLPVNQKRATARMEAGDSPKQITKWLSENGDYPDYTQYAIVDLNNGQPRSAAFSGKNMYEKWMHITGTNYAIAGNTLISQDVIKDMEKAFLRTRGSLADKLMAALQGAKRPGADSRCLSDGISSGSAYLRVADSADTDNSYGKLSLDLNVWITTDIFEPIDALQEAYDNGKNCKEVQLVIKTDQYPEETRWQIKDQDNKIVASGGPYNRSVEITECLKEGRYTFTIKDSHGDGICCQYGRGHYKLSAGGEILASGGNFNHIEATTFIIGNTTKNDNLSLQMPELKPQTPIVKIYPNPAMDVVTIKTHNTTITSYEIQDIFGKRITKRGSSSFSPNNIIYLDVIDYVPGVYFITTFNGMEKLGTQRLIVN
ncbi:DUF1028 domain-containing protein [Aquimarina macrocephali]|uniref:DUF1028 domain-containing protein n=1 Tax=Aquimarina macrocephali TaxID=666563 RepID=UPI000466D1A9|nr:DUF1028 domain-containing protein [Aquimarina macrocephali]